MKYLIRHKFKVTGILGAVAAVIAAIDFDLFMSIKDYALKVILGIPLLGAVFESKLLEFFESFTTKRGDKTHNKKEVTKEEALLNLKKVADKVAALSRERVKTLGSSKLINFIGKQNWTILSGPDSGKEHLSNLNELISGDFGSKGFAIVGDSGTGKTSALHNYIAESYRRMERRPAADRPAIPVYFSMYSWRDHPDIESWLVERFQQRYNLTAGVAEKIVTEYDDQFVVVFDGMDQAADSYRPKFYSALCQWMQNHPVIVTTQKFALEDLKEVFKNAADHDLDTELDLLQLNPFTAQQQQKIISSLPNNERVLELINKSKQIEKFAQTPMGLFLLINTADELADKTISTIDSLSEDEIFGSFWNLYSQHIYEDEEFTKSKRVIYSRKQMTWWMNRLVSNKTLPFYIDNLQPWYLSSKRFVRHYYLLSRIILAIAFSIAAGFFLSGPLEFFNPAIVTGLVAASVIYFFRKGFYKMLNVADMNPRQLSALKTKERILRYLKVYAIYLFPLLLVLTLYFGFSTPRIDKPEEMIWGGTFSKTEMNAGILFAILMTMLFGHRGYWQQKDRDIRAARNVRYSPANAMRLGLAGGVVLSLLLLGVTVIIVQINSTGILDWLRNNTYSENFYQLAAITGFIIGFVLFGIFGFLRETDEPPQQDRRTFKIFKLRFSLAVYSNLVTATKAGIIATIFVLIVPSLFIVSSGEVTLLIKTMITSFAFGSVAFLAFGGIDAICHLVLRFVIYLENSGPLNFERFMEQAVQMRYMNKSGDGYELYHPSQYNYFLNQNENRSTAQNNRFTVPLLVIFCCVPVVVGLVDRHTNSSYWQDPNVVKIEIAKDAPVRFLPNSDNKVVIQERNSDMPVDLRIIADGKIKVGTFTGYVSSGGTEASFLGLKMQDSYDRPEFKQFNHAALIVNNLKSGTKTAMPEPDLFGLLESRREIWIQALPGDILSFEINDLEWQNNKSNFTVSIQNMERIKYPELIAHRGGAGNAQENSLEAIELAISSGVKKVEIDVQMLADKTLVLMHDSRLNRTTNGRGLLRNKTLSELREMRIDQQLDSTSKEVDIPTLNQVLALMQDNDLELLIEVKNPKQTPGIGYELDKLLRHYNAVDRVQIFSFDTDFIKKFGTTYDDYDLGIFCFSPFKEFDLRHVNNVGVYYPSVLIFKKKIDSLQRLGYKVYAWTVNKEQSMQRLTNMNIDGLITDYPERYFNVVKARNEEN